MIIISGAGDIDDPECCHQKDNNNHGDVGQNGWIAKIPESLMLVFGYFTSNFNECTAVL